MKRLVIALSAACVVAIAGVGVGYAQNNQASVSIPADKIGFGPTGVKAAAGELRAGPAYGDLSKGQHGTFIRMPAGFVSAPHTHTEDYFGIVIQGVAANGLVGAPDVSLPVGSYWFQKGKEKHITKCLAATECLFFIYQPGKFDYLPAN